MGVLEFMLIVLMLSPLGIVLFSKRVRGWRKFGWFLVALWLPLIGFVLFLLLTKKPENNTQSD